MNIAQLSEQLKDVPQAKLIDYAKNPNSVVPQFLALAEIQRRQTLMRSMPAQAPQSSVAEDIMAQESPRMSGVAQLPTRAMFTEEGMAGGGIVAFADGGDAEEEYEEALEKSKRSRMQGIQEALAEAGAYFRNPLAKAEVKPTQQQRLAEQEMQMNAPVPVQRKGSHKYEDLVLAEAQRQGIDPSLARHVLYKETGNLPNPESAKSKAGAIGIMQLMPKTAKELGVDPTNPEENIRGGIMYLRKMMDKYNDPVLAAAAYNAGPGRVDKALRGEGLTALPRETRMYIAGLAEGGEVKRYAKAGSVKDEEEDNPYLERSRGLYEGVRSLGSALTDPANYDLYKMYQEYIGQPFERGAKRFVNMPVEEQAQRFRSYSMTPNAAPTVGYSAPVQTPAPTPTPAPTKTKPETPKQSDQAEVRRVDNEIAARQQFTYPPQGGIGPTAAELGIGAQETPKGVTSQSYFDALMKNIEAQAADAKRQGDQNKYLALMQAGFGMMASQSPYAATGIGQGAMTGLGTYAGLEKGRREQERGLMSTQLGLARAKAGAEEAEATREATKLYREQVLGQRADAATTQAEDRALSRIQKLDTDIEKAVRKEIDANPILAMSQDKEKIVERRIAEAKARHPLYSQYYKQAGLGDFSMPPPVAIPQGAIDALKKNPKLKTDFDAKYGTGAADKYLGK